MRLSTQEVNIKISVTKIGMLFVFGSETRTESQAR